MKTCRLPTGELCRVVSEYLVSRELDETPKQRTKRMRAGRRAPRVEYTVMIVAETEVTV